jgi:hypothetical protein
VALGLVLEAAGVDDLLGVGEVAGLGVEALFSVVTETLGSEVVASGTGAGDGLSSWASANGVAAAKRAVIATRMIFIWFSPVGQISAAGARPGGTVEARIVGATARLRQGSIAVQDQLAVIVL